MVLQEAIDRYVRDCTTQDSYSIANNAFIISNAANAIGVLEDIRDSLAEQTPNAIDMHEDEK